MQSTRLSSNKDDSCEISVIVPTLNRGQVLHATIKQVLAQSDAKFELIIVDQSDVEDAVATENFCIALKDSRLQYEHIDRKNLPNARNFGISRAKAPIILFLDDDIILLTDHFLTAHLVAYNDPTVGGATGRSVERSLFVNCRRTACHVSIGGRTIFNLMGTEQQLIGGCKGSNMSYRASVLPKVGGFDRQTELLEDADFSLRVIKAGWKVMFLPEAEIIHLSTNSGGVRLNGLLHEERRRFRSTTYFIIKHRGILGMIPFLATFFLIALARTYKFRSISAIPQLCYAIIEGLYIWKIGKDEDIVT